MTCWGHVEQPQRPPHASTHYTLPLSTTALPLNTNPAINSSYACEWHALKHSSSETTDTSKRRNLVDDRLPISTMLAFMDHRLNKMLYCRSVSSSDETILLVPDTVSVPSKQGIVAMQKGTQQHALRREQANSCSGSPACSATESPYIAALSPDSSLVLRNSKSLRRRTTRVHLGCLGYCR